MTASSADRIVLTGLRCRGRHGVFESERSGQLFVVDAALVLDLRPAADTDDLGSTVDYAALARRLAAVVEGAPVALVETLAQRLADVCLSDARVQRAEVTVHKPQAGLDVGLDDIAVHVVRERL